MRQETKSALARQMILDAAMEEFSEHGYMDASLNRVCQEKNLSKGRIYHYFRDKDELYLSVIRQGLFYVPFILTLPRSLGVRGLYFAQPSADILTLITCLFLIRPMKKIASRNIQRQTLDMHKSL